MEWTIELDEFIIAVAWSPDGSRLAAATASGVVCVLDASNGEETQYFRAHQNSVLQLAWSPRGDVLATSGQDGTAKLWNPATSIPQNPDGDLLTTLECGMQSAWVEHLRWSPDGQYLATATGRNLTFWRSDGTLHHRTEPHPKTIVALAWSPRSFGLTGSTGELAAASLGSVMFYDIDDTNNASDALDSAEPFTKPQTITSRIIAPRTVPIQNAILGLTYSPDGKLLAAGLQENGVHFWRSPFSAETASAMRGYPEKISHVAFDASSTLLATPSGRGVVVWSFLGGGPEGTQPVVVKEHTARVTQAVFQHRGGLLASSDESGTVLISQPAGTGATLRGEGYGQEVSALAWSPDDARLAVGTGQGIVDVWVVQKV